MIPYVFVTDELQVEVGFKAPVREFKSLFGRKTYGPMNPVFVEQNVLQECFLAVHIKLTRLIRYLRGCVRFVSLVFCITLL